MLPLSITAIRSLIAVTALSGLAIVGACQPNTSSERNIVFNMSWLPQGSMVGVIVAIDRGYYTQEGLNVSAMRGFGGMRTVNELDHGLFEFGYIDPITIALNRAHGGKTRMIRSTQRSMAGSHLLHKRTSPDQQTC